MICRLLLREYFNKSLSGEVNFFYRGNEDKVKGTIQKLYKKGILSYAKNDCGKLVLSFKSDWNLVTSRIVIDSKEAGAQGEVIISNHFYLKALFVIYFIGAILFSLASLWIINNPTGWVLSGDPYSLVFAGFLVALVGAAVYKIHFMYEFYRSRKLFKFYFKGYWKRNEII